MRGVLLLMVSLTGVLGAQAPDMSVRAGDLVRLRIYLEPDLSGEFPVNELGVVALPRLGEIPISTWPEDSIRPRLTRMYAEYLRDPVVEITVLRRVAIYGAVLKPGLYPVDPTLTIQEALALAGGPAPDGQRDRVELLRGDQRISTDLDLAAPVEQVRLQSGDQLFVPQRSWLARNTWLVGSLVGVATTGLALVLR